MDGPQHPLQHAPRGTASPAVDTAGLRPAAGQAGAVRGRRGTVAVQSLGCKANQEEMECLLSRLGEAGFEVVPFGVAADWTIVNTCTVTREGDADSRQMIRRALRGRENGRVVVTGCLAQRDARGVGAIEGVDWVIGNAEKHLLPDWIVEASPDAGPGASTCAAFEPASPVAGSGSGIRGPWVRVSADPGAGGFAAYGSGRAGRRTRATLKIQDGCDEHCTFCVIPQVRGPHRSRSLESVVTEAARLVAAGYREISLTGINTALWGGEAGRDLPDLCREMARVAGLDRLRLNSLEPQYVSEDWISRFAEIPALCPHYHLPLQSGDPEILRRMNRRYTPAQYARVVDRLRRLIPSAAIGADVLVGFCGETEGQFRNTLRLLESLPLAYLHVFSYSPRPETASLRLGEPVAAEVRRERSRRLRDLDRRLRARFAAELLDTIQQVVPERPARRGAPDDLVWEGVTGNYRRVRFAWPAAVRARRELPLVLLESAGADGVLHGRILGAPGGAAAPDRRERVKGMV